MQTFLILFSVYLLSAIISNVMLNRAVKDGLSFEPYNENFVINFISALPVVNTILVLKTIYFDILTEIAIIKIKRLTKLQKNKNEILVSKLHSKFIEFGFSEEEAADLVKKIKESNIIEKLKNNDNKE